MKVQIGCELIDTRGWVERGGEGGCLGVCLHSHRPLYPRIRSWREGQVPAVIESSNGITFDTLCTEMYSLIKVQASVYKIVLTIYLTYGTLKYDFYFLI